MRANKTNWNFVVNNCYHWYTAQVIKRVAEMLSPDVAVVPAASRIHLLVDCGGKTTEQRCHFRSCFGQFCNTYRRPLRWCKDTRRRSCRTCQDRWPLQLLHFGTHRIVRPRQLRLRDSVGRLPEVALNPLARPRPGTAIGTHNQVAL